MYVWITSFCFHLIQQVSCQLLYLTLLCLSPQLTEWRNVANTAIKERGGDRWTESQWEKRRWAGWKISKNKWTIKFFWSNNLLWVHSCYWSWFWEWNFPLVVNSSPPIQPFMPPLASWCLEIPFILLPKHFSWNLLIQSFHRPENLLTFPKQKQHLCPLLTLIALCFSSLYPSQFFTILLSKQCTLLL